MSKQNFESILLKLGELKDRAQNNVNSIKDLELTTKNLLNNLKSLCARASDVEEEIKKAESDQKKRKRDVEDWLGKVKSIEKEVVESEGFISRFVVGEKSAQLNEQVCKLIEQPPQFGKAFAENMERIWRLLESGQVARIGVHGAGGIGKTMLATQIENRLRKQSQVRVLWVTVSQEFTIKSLQDKIASSLGVNFLDEDDELIRAGRLHGALSEKKNPVLILDDVWEYIDLLKLGCPFSVECCRLIITTRSLNLCHQIGCQKMIEMKKLDEDEAWKLFNETLTLRTEVKLGPQIEEIAKSVAKLCDGLPLGIILVAGSMRGETSIHTWAIALAELKEYVLGQDGMGKVEIFKILKYSFSRLNINHQSENNVFNMFQLCFLYCSLYSEGRAIPRGELVQSFISAGLVDHRSRRAQVHQGHMVLDKLVNVCLLERKVDFDGDECVEMNDLVRGMSLNITRGKYMVRAGDMSLREIRMEEEWTEDLEKVSLMDNYYLRRIGEGTSPNCPNLTTLLLRDSRSLEFIPDSIFSKMQGLCTLDLCRTTIRKLPDSLSGLRSLKALLLEGCRWLKIVPYLGKLKALRELNLDYTGIEEVPQGVEELLNLKFLSINLDLLETFPRILLVKLVRLQCVRFPNHLDVPVEEMDNLKELDEFRGRVKSVGDFNSFITSRAHDTFYRVRIGLLGEDYDFGDCNKGVSLSECNLEDEKVLGHDIECLAMRKCEGLSKCLLDGFSRLNNPRSLRRLIIETCGGIECILRSEQGLASQISTLEYINLADLEDFKGLIEKGEIGVASAAPAQAVFSSLKRLAIFMCNKMRKLGLPVLGFPNLEEIRIMDCSEIEEIFEDEGRAASLPRLKLLSLSKLPRLKSVCKATIFAFPNLESIDILCCEEMEEIFKDEGRGSLTLTLTLPRLRRLSLSTLPRMKRICKATIFTFPNLVGIWIQWCDEVEVIFEDEGRDSLTLLPRLEQLTLVGLPKLKSVCKATIICNSIQQIYISQCPRMMKKLPLHLDVPPPPSLRGIYVEREWWESLEWDNPNLPTLLRCVLHCW